MTLSAAAHNDLQRLQELMRHQVPDGDPALIVARALALLREQVEKRRLGLRRNSVRKRSHAVRLEAARVIGKNPCSRYIPAAIRHEVAARDLQQCAFVTADGRRCGERNWLEFHHIVPHARGGRAIAGNLELRCRAHNRYEAEREFDGSVREGAGRYEASGWNQAGRADFVDTGANRN
ncbi:MAG TPA: HNH endonuclease, partial [Candidatus Eisenbacteria bacterium]